MVKCSNCGSFAEDDIKICLKCGRKLNAVDLNLNSHLHYNLDFSQPEEIQNEIRGYFFKIMRYRVENELDAKGYRNYFDHFHSSGFYKKFDLRSKQLVEEVISMNAENKPSSQHEIDSYLSQVLESFVDYFIIAFCKPLHRMLLPEAILRYGNVQKEKVDLGQMILEYLDFNNEKDKIYTDFLTMPVNKLKNAKEAFLFGEKDEKLFFICDQTVFKSCKEGFAMTDEALYWKPHFNEVGKVVYKEIKSVKREGEWITINEQFFNVNKSMNYKMMKLLQKLQNILNC